jgi:hypothetical protein
MAHPFGMVDAGAFDFNKLHKQRALSVGGVRQNQARGPGSRGEACQSILRLCHFAKAIRMLADDRG